MSIAHGTIAFDTLTTSDQVNTGTEKSIDTSYIFNGVAKVWNNVNQAGTQAIQDSFNISGITDTATGFTTNTFTNAMNNSVYSTTACCEYNTMQGTNGPATSSVGIVSMNSSGSYEDRDDTSIQIMGDLA